MALRTPLYAQHVAAGAKLVDFGGWDMPLHYGSQIDEHNAVRESAGLFDVSHMTVVDISGTAAREYLRYLLANDVARLVDPGTALYSCMLNNDGGVVDDLIVYYLRDGNYRLVVNAATRDKDLAWINAQATGFDLTIDERSDLAMIALQGPDARSMAAQVFPADVQVAADVLKPFHASATGELFVARTGYTGEDGYEIILPAASAPGWWQRVIDAGLRPAGLGARDTLRLEAGLNLYGSDMDETTTPLESGLGWTIAWEPAERAFVGREALMHKRDDPACCRFTGLLLEGRGVLRGHQRVVVAGGAIGEITSGGFSPTLKRSIALARLPAGKEDHAQVDVRGKLLDVRIVQPPFVRHGKICIDL